MEGGGRREKVRDFVSIGTGKGGLLKRMTFFQGRELKPNALLRIVGTGVSSLTSTRKVRSVTREKNLTRWTEWRE